VTVQVDHDQKVAAQQVFGSLGLDLETAIGEQTVQEEKLPFKWNLVDQALAEVKSGNIVTFASEQDFYHYLDQ